MTLTRWSVRNAENEEITTIVTSKDNKEVLDVKIKHKFKEYYCFVKVIKKEDFNI